MAEGPSASGTTGSAYRTTVGRPKRFSQRWASVMKRIYVSEGTLLELREFKKSSDFTSDESAIQYLLNQHKFRTKECTDSPSVDVSWTRQMPMSSTPVSGSARAKTREPTQDCCLIV